MVIQRTMELIYEHVDLELQLLSLKYYYMYIFIQQIFVGHLLCVKQGARCVIYLKQSARCWEATAGKGGSMVECKYLGLDDKKS